MSSIIDILIYAHDGRGLGHVSRSVAIGLALRRLFPNLSVLFVTGCGSTAELIGGGNLDWVKLPSYRTSVSEGKSCGAMGPANIEDKLLGTLRADNISDIVEAYKPKVVLADHTPQGKHQELMRAVKGSTDTTWVLGVRAVVGDVDKVWSELSATVFDSKYSNILWYGDSDVTGTAELDKLSEHYKVTPFEAGYVSRLKELRRLGVNSCVDKKIAGVISVPWSGEGTFVLLEKISQVIGSFDPSEGIWKVYMNLNESGSCDVNDFFARYPNVVLEQVGPSFLADLANSRSAIIYGGYNSLTDVMSAGVPSVVFLRGMKDGEQEEHAATLQKASDAIVDVYSEDEVSVDGLRASLEKCLASTVKPSSISLNGAANAARYLSELAGVYDVNG
ncbi:glycosyltransferase [Maridesulfovibrio frigidus]|uniref:glycosyltransferase n=1 Tax=Maridesulfovibrio frigidus TaxID=340956 RepID=UPI0004E0FF7F|nr:glycosyltransferase [Maridesulfovibrio frigidus]